MTLIKEVGEPEIAQSYTVGYQSDAADFRFYVMALVAVTSLAGFLFFGHIAYIVLFVFSSAAAFYFYPLTEKGKPRLGAGEYGIFVDGLGIIDWRAVHEIDLYATSVRTIVIKQLHIKLRASPESALIADWRLASIPRLFMRLPWKLANDNVIIINMEPFAARPEIVHERLMQIWRQFGYPRRRVDK